jgi:uncharacterized protein (TIGR00369 family)
MTDAASRRGLSPRSIPSIPNHLFSQLPFYEVTDTDDLVEIELRNRPDITNGIGAIQGGMVATLIDVAGGYLAANVAPQGHGVTTADMTIHYLTPIHVGPARAIATPARVGKRLIVVGVDVMDTGRNCLAARATLSFAVLVPPSPPQAIEKCGSP